jgi:hypothetical protein
MASGIKIRPTFGVALAIVAGVVLTPAIATAGCGDHVHILNKNPDVTGVSYPVESGEKLPLTPCSGPDCSANPASSGIPSGFPISNPPEIKSSAARDEEVRDAADHSSWGAIIENDETSSPQSGSIFHPPRP